MNTNTSNPISTLIIVDNQNKITTTHKVEKPITIISSNTDSDIVLPGLPKAGFSIIKETNGYKLLSMFEKQISDVPWNKLLKDITIFKLNHLTFAFFPNIAIASAGDSDMSNRESDFGSFVSIPQNPKDKNFPSKLLEFLLKMVGADQGALFYYDNLELEVPRELASFNFEINEHGMSMLQRYLRDNNESFQQLNFQTHSMLFSSKHSMHANMFCDFILLRTPCIDKGEVLLYIPKPLSKSKQFNHYLSTFLYLSSYALSLHVIYLHHERALKRIIENQSFNAPYWGSSPKMLRLKQLTDRLASTDLSILITGETGVGKEGLAQYILRKSEGKKIVCVNCAAIPVGLAESILFGHIKGSFTNAHSNQIGKFQEANNGILFLDEIAELSLEIQGKLLRVLQDGFVTPVGGKSEKIKVRVLAATHQDLFSLVKEKKFREDLYYRLNEATLHIPPLRERCEDILPLAQHFLEEATVANNLPEGISFDRNACEKLKSYKYPGNIRELRSIIRKATILNNTGVINSWEIEELLIDQGQAQAQGQNDKLFNFNNKEWPFPQKLEDAKKIFLKNQIAYVLKLTSDNKTKAAELLGIAPRSLFRLLAELNSNGNSNCNDKYDSDNDSSVRVTHTLKDASKSSNRSFDRESDGVF
ncbi:MAG: sigma-54-dependent Fis family transcriptional regulator [Oligoflexia bacterium]|nr:sigma-54-dependent Fis family transcriptional regulator [Oligoflexia bacterium]